MLLQVDDEAVELNKELVSNLLELDDVDAVYTDQKWVNSWATALNSRRARPMDFVRVYSLFIDGKKMLGLFMKPGWAPSALPKNLT